MAIQSLPRVWLLSDARNDALLERALTALPAHSGFVFRHYHLTPARRAQRFVIFAQLAREHGHIIAVSQRTLNDAQGCRGDPYGCRNAVYGHMAGPSRANDLILATAHNGAEVAAANRAKADAVFISPVFATRSHRHARPLGPDGFRALAAAAMMPAIALGGMTAERAAAHEIARWGAIDGLSPAP